MGTLPAAPTRTAVNYSRKDAKAHAFAHMKGIWAAALMPFREDLSIDEDGFRANMDHWIGDLGIDGFFIGRYDIRYASDDDLRAGHSFQIIELNGAASEATSIYDSRNSLLAAYRTLFRQWELVFAIGAENRRRGSKPTGLALLWRKWRETDHLIATYPLAD